LPSYVAVIDNEEAKTMNSVNLTGNLATDVELREFGDDKKLATFVLAVDRSSRDDDADFFRVATWDHQAQLCAEYLEKGRKVAVEGRLRHHTWEDNGEKRSRVEVVARRVEFLGPRTSDTSAEVVPFEAAVA
jgi:single-strand DNA-binding protein